MSHSTVADVLRRQHELAWKLAWFHIEGLATAECLWRTGPDALHVQECADGTWVGVWPEHERYEQGPPSIAWLLWHMAYWWTRVQAASFDDGGFDVEDFRCPASADGVRARLSALHERWQGALREISDSDLCSTRRARWPYENRPFADVVAWVNVELSKNAAEIGYGRFLYGSRVLTASGGQ